MTVRWVVFGGLFGGSPGGSFCISMLSVRIFFVQCRVFWRLLEQLGPSNWMSFLIVLLIFVHWCSHTAAATPNTLDGITIELHRAEFQQLDSNQDGHLDDDEIMAMMAIDYPEEQQVNQEDGNGNGKDDDISDLDVIAFIVELDQNQDGLVSWKEYEYNLLNDHAPTLEQFLPEQFEDIDGFVEAANDFVNERNGG
jgi:Ca2+-binding EF-hand superfamily protein